MKGSETKMTGFMEGADKRYVIPVYQRRYDWKLENCRQLYDDLKKVVLEKRNSHFFGSIVSSVVPNGSKIEYHIIDGQQRLTTVTLLLLAIRNLITKGEVTSNEGRLDEQINQRFLISPWAKEDDRIKLRPVKSDLNALVRLFGEEEEFDPYSNLTLNYRYFRNWILKDEIPIDDLYGAIGKLEIISITLDQGDNAQLIFESLNSTGLALQEGDKIRNYILMGQPPKDQNRLYDTYWTTIERCTENDVSGFIRDYLSVKQQVTPSINSVYLAFKEYAENTQFPIDSLLDELRRLFALYNADPVDLVFYLKDQESEKMAEADRFEIRKRYWTYALPIIQKQHIHRGTFSNCSPGTANTESGFFGINGFKIICVANYDSARIDFYLGKENSTQNKNAFDLLYSHKDEIETELGISLTWERADGCKASWISYHLPDVSIVNESDWPRMARFHAEWSNKICNTVLPYLQNEDDNCMRLLNIAGILHSWTVERSNVIENLSKSNRTYTRFMTGRMSKIIPDIPGRPSGWGTDNHYFYEIVNRNGRSVYIHLALSAQNATDDFLALCDRINKFYPVRKDNEEWKWRIPFKTSTFDIDEELSADKIFAKLDDCFAEIQVFEADLEHKLKI